MAAAPLGIDSLRPFLPLYLFPLYHRVMEGRSIFPSSFFSVEMHRREGRIKEVAAALFTPNSRFLPPSSTILSRGNGWGKGGGFLFFPFPPLGSRESPGRKGGTGSRFGCVLYSPSLPAKLPGDQQTTDGKRRLFFFPFLLFFFSFPRPPSWGQNSSTRVLWA